MTRLFFVRRYIYLVNSQCRLYDNNIDLDSPEMVVVGKDC